jgi:hypothetical protein
MSLTADIIRERFPGRAELGPDEVAAVLHGRTDRSAVQRVREELDRGLLVPGLRKRGGRWRVPVGPLVAALDGLAETAPSASPAPAGRHTVVIPAPVPAQKRRGRVPDAVRLANAMAWGSAVLFELRELERLDNLAAADEQAAELDDATGPAMGGSRPPIRP